MFYEKEYGKFRSYSAVYVWNSPSCPEFQRIDFRTNNTGFFDRVFVNRRIGILPDLCPVWYFQPQSKLNEKYYPGI
jgi:hypothetical protein